MDRFKKGFIGFCKQAELSDKQADEMYRLGEAIELAGSDEKIAKALDKLLLAAKKAAESNEPDWLDQRPGGDELGGRVADFGLNENKRLNRALSAGTKNENVADPHSSYETVNGEKVPWRTAQADKFPGIYGADPVSQKLNQGALGSYDNWRPYKTPRESEEMLLRVGYGDRQIQFIRDLIRRGVIQAKNTVPGTASGLSASKTAQARVTGFSKHPWAVSMRNNPPVRNIRTSPPFIGRGLGDKIRLLSNANTSAKLPPPPSRPKTPAPLKQLRSMHMIPDALRKQVDEMLKKRNQTNSKQAKVNDARR